MTHVSHRFPEGLAHVAARAEELSGEVQALPHGDLPQDPVRRADLQAQVDDFRAHLLAMERKAAAISRELGAALVNRAEAVSRSAESLALTSGPFILEKYDLEGGLVSMQVRGPVAIGGWVGTGDATSGVLPLGRVVALSDKDADKILMRRLRLLGELG